MKETTPVAMPPCFERWCQRFNDVFTHKAQKREFRHYVGGLLGESERKNLFQIAENAVGVTYHRLHHFYTQRTKAQRSQVNERRLEMMNKCSQTRISRGFSLIIDDSGQAKEWQLHGWSRKAIYWRNWQKRFWNSSSNNAFIRWKKKLTIRYRVISAR